MNNFCTRDRREGGCILDTHLTSFRADRTPTTCYGAMAGYGGRLGNNTGDAPPPTPSAFTESLTHQGVAGVPETHSTVENVGSGAVATAPIFRRCSERYPPSTRDAYYRREAHGRSEEPKEMPNISEI